MHNCDACRYLYEMRGEEASCEECIPELLPENVDAARVYQVVHNQRITAGMSGVTIDVNIGAVLSVIKLFGIEDEEGCFMKVLRLCREQYALEHEEASAEHEDKK